MGDRPLLAFSVHAGAPQECAVFVWAYDEDEAATLARAYTFCDDEPLIVDRIDMIDGTAPETARVEARAAVLRIYGWSREDDRFCHGCDLAEIGGAFRVCPECDCCEECGHAPDCSEREEVSDGT